MAPLRLPPASAPTLGPLGPSVKARVSPGPDHRVPSPPSARSRMPSLNSHLLGHTPAHPAPLPFTDLWLACPFGAHLVDPWQGGPSELPALAHFLALVPSSLLSLRQLTGGLSIPAPRPESPALPSVRTFPDSPAQDDRAGPRRRVRRHHWVWGLETCHERGDTQQFPPQGCHGKEQKASCGNAAVRPPSLRPHS